MSKILDDAREKIGGELLAMGMFYKTNEAIMRNHLVAGIELKERTNRILAISGTTDIECSECKGQKWVWENHGSEGYQQDECSTCHGNGIIKHKWEMGVHLENGELPEIAEWAYGKAAKLDAEVIQEDMIKAGYVQEVRQAVE